MRARYLSIFIAMLGSLTVTTPVWSDDDEDRRKRATELFQRGLQEFDRGNYADACPLFEQSLKLYRGLGTRGRLADCYENLGRVASAYRLYLQVKKLALQNGDTERATAAAERAAALEPRLASLVITPDDSFEVAGFVVTNDGREVEPRRFGTSLFVDPGTHRIKATAPGHEPWTKVVKVAEGESRGVDIPALTPTGGTVDVSTRANVDTRSGRSSARTPSYVLLGFGVVGLATSGYFGQRASSTWNSITKDCRLGDATACTDEDYEDKQQVDEDSAIANYAAIAGGVLLVTGTVVWLLSRGDDKPKSNSSVTVTPVVAPDQVGVMLRGSL